MTSATAPTAELHRLADRIRLQAVRMVAPQGFGYLGQALSAAEIFAVLYGRFYRPGRDLRWHDPPRRPRPDRYTAMGVRNIRWLTSVHSHLRQELADIRRLAQQVAASEVTAAQARAALSRTAMRHVRTRGARPS